MRILVTGATSFIGNHLVNELLTRGHTIIVSSTDRTKAAAFSWFDKVEFVQYMITREEPDEDLYTLFGSPDAVIHLAWQGLPNYNASFHIDTNLLGHYFFLKNLIHNGLKDLSITGTCLEYGLHGGSLTEDLPTDPIVPYAIAKDCLNKMISVLVKEYNVSYKWIRLFYMYGPGQNSRSLIPSLDQAVKEGQPYFNLSGGEQVRDFLTVKEVAKYIGLISLQDKVTGNINCCSAAPVSIKQFVNEYVKEHTLSIELRFGHYPYLSYEPMSFWGDNTKMLAALAG